MSLELIRLLVIAPLILFFGFFGGTFAIRALILLYGNPEVIKIQKKIWLPILTSAGLIMVVAITHVSEHFVGPSLAGITNFLSEVLLITSLAFLVTGIYQYWRFQARYNRLKREAQQRAGRTPSKA